MIAKIPDAVNLILSDARGVYIPRDFVTDNYKVAVDHCKAWNITQEDAEILASGPDHEFYWETWDTVLSNAQYTDEEGNKYVLSQDGDLWAFCYERMTEEEKSNFGMDDPMENGKRYCAENSISECKAEIDRLLTVLNMHDNTPASWAKID